MKQKWATKLAASFLGLMLVMAGCATPEEEAETSSASSQTQESSVSQESENEETGLPAALTVGVLKGPTVWARCK